MKVETDAGIYGMGEAGMKRRAAPIVEVLRAIEPALLGQDPFRIEYLWQIMFRGGFFPGGDIQTCAVSAVDIALWDIKAKALGVPVYELLGGRVRDNLGAEMEIIVDVHTRLDAPASIQLCNGVAPFHPFFVEDPLRSENPAALRLVRQHTSVPLAVGEQWAGKWAFREVIEEDLMDYCRLDLCISGGLTEARKIAGWCETHYISLVPHNPLGPVSTAACLHLCLASPLVGVQELPRVPGTTLTNVFPRQVPFDNGYLQIPDGPSLGVEFDEDAAMVELQGEQPRPSIWLKREDGSYNNW